MEKLIMSKRSLRDLEQRCCVVYDDDIGEIIGPTDLLPCGWTAMLDGQRLAKYVNDDRHLILQISSDKFDLDSSETTAYGHNDYETNTATFRITQDNRQRHLRYAGWWTAWDFGKIEVMARAEMDESEDTMGWVWRVLSDPEAREDTKKHLLTLRCS
jgi:hypothetical protein